MYIPRNVYVTRYKSTYANGDHSKIVDKIFRIVRVLIREFDFDIWIIHAYVYELIYLIFFSRGFFYIFSSFIYEGFVAWERFDPLKFRA